MVASQRKRFRIERLESRGMDAAEPGDAGGYRHQQLMDAIGQLRDTLAPQQEISTELLDRYRNELDEAQKIKRDMEEIYRAIADTKKDIATLHHTGFGEEHFSTVSHQLDAVVTHTETATEVILSAAEQIDNDASNLAASLTGPDNEMAADIQDQVIKIFESCNFQDITGQRITKVVETLKFIEARVDHMIDIWGGIDSFEEIDPMEMEKPEGDAALLNGPALSDAANMASQDDIDALFD